LLLAGNNFGIFRNAAKAAIELRTRKLNYINLQKLKAGVLLFARAKTA
jgi:hypothetical protein